jgi:hypothetical protein
MDQQLVRRLKRAGRKVETLRLANGSEVLCLPCGGRILGLFAPGDQRNFYWVNSALDDSAKARTFFASKRWQNTGGERIWLGPESDFFFPRFPDMSLYHQPRPLDTGIFRVERTVKGLRLGTAFTVRSNQHKVRLKLRLTKSIETAANPLRNWAGCLRMKNLRYAGYTQRTRLEFARSSATNAPVGLWSLTQMPQGGEMVIATLGKSDPRVFFGKVPRGDLRVTPANVHCRMRAGGNMKIGVRALSVTGRVGYLYELSGAAHLVVRNFLVDPSGEYVDGPWTDLADSGYCVQTCNVSDQELGHFSEMEYHVPAIGGATGESSSEDVAQIWAYRGSRGQIQRIAEKLLGVSSWLNLTQ